MAVILRRNIAKAKPRVFKSCSFEKRTQYKDENQDLKPSKSAAEPLSLTWLASHGAWVSPEERNVTHISTKILVAINKNSSMGNIS